MSLNQLARQVQSKGRGKDTMLVHMSPREVQGLQALAMAHGGSLSRNPDTGLPEAGFLEQILPVVAAGAITAMTAGAAAPSLAAALGTSTATGGLLAGAGIGALVGGGMSALQGGNFGQGALMGGLSGAVGGFGGAGGFEGLFGSTAPTISPTTGAVVEGSAMIPPPATTTPVPQPSVTTVPAPTVTSAPVTPPPSTAMDIGFGPGNFAPQQAAPIDIGFGPDKFTPPATDIQGMSPEQFKTFQGQGGTAPAAQKGINVLGYNISPGEAALGLGGIGLLSSLSDRKRYGIPSTGSYTSPIARISPNFQGYVPAQPRPYYQAQYPTYAAEGGIMRLANGGPVERMTAINTAMNPQGGLYPQGMIDKTQYATPTQRPASLEMLNTEPAYERSNPLIGTAGLAKGGISNLGDYSDGGRLLRGPGDGVSDSIPAQIGERQPARLADGEFVVPARIVSELGNGSTDAGARKLYAMMDRVQSARRKSMKKGKHAVDSKAEKLLPA